MTGVGVFGLLGTWAYLDQALVVGSILGGFSLLLGMRMHQEYSFATVSIQETLLNEPVVQTIEQPREVEEKLLLPQPAPTLD
jgi:hypothetical protein